MKLKQQENSKGDILNQRLMAEIKNIKENNRVLEECLKDRQKTINELKNTLRIIGGLDSKKEEENYERTPFTNNAVINEEMSMQASRHDLEEILQ